MLTSESNHRSLVQINLPILLELYHVNLGVEFHSTFFAKLRKAFFSAKPRTPVTARKQPGAALIAWKTVTRRRTGQCALSLVWTGPCASLGAWCACFVAPESATRVLACYLCSVKKKDRWSGLIVLTSHLDIHRPQSDPSWQRLGQV